MDPQALIQALGRQLAPVAQQFAGNMGQLGGMMGASLAPRLGLNSGFEEYPGQSVYQPDVARQRAAAQMMAVRGYGMAYPGMLRSVQPLMPSSMDSPEIRQYKMDALNQMFQARQQEQQAQLMPSYPTPQQLMPPQAVPQQTFPVRPMMQAPRQYQIAPTMPAPSPHLMPMPRQLPMPQVQVQNMPRMPQAYTPNVPLMPSIGSPYPQAPQPASVSPQQGYMQPALSRSQGIGQIIANRVGNPSTADLASAWGVNQ